MNSPEYALSVLRGLEAAGFRAHLVGGCVRDVVLGRRPKDWDVCTNALPDSVMGIFPNSRPTGIKHGTVTVVMRGRSVEVTTYRTDGVYVDHRRPDSVEFISDLKSDLARRDFTMNAIAMDAEGEMFDPFRGRADIFARVIRCVGNADRRFEEDALRMLRVLRFSAVLGFEIEARTMEAMERSSHLIKYVAPERICAELEKTLLSERPEITAKMLEISALEGQFPTADAKRIRYLPKNRAMRLAALCALMVRNGLISDPKSFLLSLRLDSYVVKHSSAGCALAPELTPPVSPLDLKRLIAAHGDDTAMCAASAAYALYGGGIMRTMRAVRACGECCGLSELAISGDELVSLGFSGRAVGEAMHRLLEHVIICPWDNDNKTLIRLAKNLTRVI